MKDYNDHECTCRTEADYRALEAALESARGALRVLMGDYRNSTGNFVNIPDEALEKVLAARWARTNVERDIGVDWYSVYDEG